MKEGNAYSLTGNTAWQREVDEKRKKSFRSLWEKSHEKKDVRRMGELNERDILYNEVLKTVKEYGQKMHIGLIVAVLAEIEGDINRIVNHENFSAVCEKLEPREYKRHQKVSV